MKTNPPNMWYMNRTRVMGNHGAYCVMNPSRINVAAKLRCLTMKYGSAATQGRLVHQIHGFPRVDMRAMSGCPGNAAIPRVVDSAEYRTGRAGKGQDPAGAP